MTILPKRLTTRLLAVIVILLLAGGLGLYAKHSSTKTSPKPQYPEYLSFVGKYVFGVPSTKVVDEQSISGFQLVYSGSVKDQTLNQIYEANNITLQPMTFLKDNKKSTFKKYIKDTFVSAAAKDLSADAKTQFETKDGWDIAKVTFTRSGQPVRFVYFKNGQHPVSVVSKQETAEFKKIEESLSDVENSDLKAEVPGIKKAIQDTEQLLRDKKATELYKQAAPELRAQNSEIQITASLKAIEVYSQGTMVVNGGSYKDAEFTSLVKFAPLNKDFQPAPGVFFLKKVDGVWKLQGMQLPNPVIPKH